MQSDLYFLRDELTAAPAAVFPSALSTPPSPARPNWRRLDYLARGNARQRSAHALLGAGVWDELSHLCQDLALVSTLAIGLDRPGSDLDVICQHGDPAQLAALLAGQGWRASDKGNRVWLLEKDLVGPDGEQWPLELYVTPSAIESLNGWRHLSLMAALLECFGHDFYRAVLALRLDEGLKGEAAMCRLLGLPGDPYETLLTLEGRDLGELVWRRPAPDDQPPPRLPPSTGEEPRPSPPANVETPHTTP